MVECFTVLADEIENRIDPHFYRPEFLELEKKIKKSKIKLLGDIASFQYGLGETAQEQGDVAYIRITDIDEFGNLKNNILAYLTYTDRFKDYKLKNGDILVARTGATYGKSLYFDENIEAVFAGYLIRIKLKDEIEISPKYLFYFMQTKNYWLQAKQIMTGGGQPQFNANTIGKLRIPLPPLETQNKIADEVKRRMQKAEQLQKEAKEDLETAKQKVERIILGEK